ncbi:MAG: ABC transporter substrate-binding protein [Oscillospiraceae bacterium]|nr:ABC transporter substrate-binding protein [Oscillospiraceae bacterium]
MKKRTLKVFSLVLVLVMALGLLASCANDDNSDVNEITIGILAPLTGGAAYFGESVRNGLMLYIDEFNARGGLQINPILRDEEGNMTIAVTMYNYLVDQNVTAIIGSVTSDPTRAIVPLAFEDNMPMITASATHAGVTVHPDTGQVFTNMFRSCFIDPFQGTKMADFAFEELGARTAAVLYSNEIAYSIGLMEAFIHRAETLGLEIVHIERHADHAVDFVGQLTNIAAHNPDVLFVPGYNYHVALIGPQSVTAGLTDTVLLGADGWAGSLERMEHDPSSIEGSFFMTGFTHESTEQHVLDFISRFEAEYGIPPNMFAAQAYDAAMILIAAIERTLAATDYEPDSEAFRLALIDQMSATDIQGVTGRITFDEFNNPQKTAFIIHIVDGVERFWGTF